MRTIFGDMDASYADKEKAKIAILPVPYDKTSTWVKGADKGPFAILEASPELELYDIETDYEVYTEGICVLPPLEVAKLSPEAMVKKVHDASLNLLEEEKFIVTIGGEHSVSIGSVMAHNRKFRNLSVLQLDAHADLRDEYKGSQFNHACVMSRVREICPAVQVGVRSMSAEEKEAYGASHIFFAHDIVKSDDWQDKVIERLSPNVYLSLDLDVLDPAIMPSTGTPQPGGLDWYTLTSFLKKVSEERTIVGFDVVELCPNEKNKAPDFLAAKLLYKLLSYIFVHKKEKGHNDEAK